MMQSDNNVAFIYRRPHLQTYKACNLFRYGENPNLKPIIFTMQYASVSEE